MSTVASINGIDTTRITALRSKLEEPGQGDTLWKAEIIWQEGFRNQIRIRDFPASYADEPEVLGGTDTTPNPVEQLLGALGSCLRLDIPPTLRSEVSSLKSCASSWRGILIYRSFSVC